MMGMYAGGEIGPKALGEAPFSKATQARQPRQESEPKGRTAARQGSEPKGRTAAARIGTQGPHGCSQ
eukprot:4770759-Prymnesium_polylepis.1